MEMEKVQYPLGIIAFYVKFMMRYRQTIHLRETNAMNETWKKCNYKQWRYDRFS